jgi:ligand-binding sensor domain-containing protein
MLKRNLIFAFSPFFIIWAFLQSSLLFSQKYSYRHYTVKEGLVQNQVITIFQDSKGYIWLGTKGGVSRFDGLGFENYTVNDGLISNYILRIFEDSEGGINFCSLLRISRIYKNKIDTVQYYLFANNIQFSINAGQKSGIVYNYDKVPELINCTITLSNPDNSPV